MINLKLFNKITKFNAELIGEILQQLEFDTRAKKINLAEQNPAQLLSILVEHEYYHQAVKFLAYGLPKREAVWWGYISALSIEGKQVDEKTLSALTAARQWVYKQTDDVRRMTEKPAQDLSFYTPASWVAIAAFWSGDNIAPLGKAEVKPTKYMAAQAVTNAIVLAAEQSAYRDRYYLRFILQGVHIANGGNGQLDNKLEQLIDTYLADKESKQCKI